MATGALIGGLPGSGSEMRIGGYECEVDRAVSYEEYVLPALYLADLSGSGARPAALPTPPMRPLSKSRPPLSPPIAHRLLAHK